MKAVPPRPERPVSGAIVLRGRDPLPPFDRMHVPGRRTPQGRRHDPRGRGRARGGRRLESAEGEGNRVPPRRVRGRKSFSQHGRTTAHVEQTLHRLGRGLEGAPRLGAVNADFLSRALARIADTPVARLGREPAVPSPSDRGRVLGRDRRVLPLAPAARHPGRQPRDATGEGRTHGEGPPSSRPRGRRATPTVRGRALPSVRPRPGGARPRGRHTRGGSFGSSTVGRRHALAYVLAGRMGLRRNEVASLRWADVNLDARTLTVRAKVAKNRRESVLPFSTADAFDALHEAGGDVLPTASVVGSLPTVRTLQADLGRDRGRDRGGAGGLPRSPAHLRDDPRAGRRAPQLLGDFMRHASYATTRAYYQHLRLADLRGVAEAAGGQAPASASGNARSVGTGV